MLWVPLSLLAVSFQTLRNALARSLAGKIAPATNSWARFTFNLPLSALLVGVLLALHGAPAFPRVFWLWCAGTAATQLLANVCLVSAFTRGNFAQAITFHRLDVLFGAFVGLWLFGEQPSALGWAGMLLSTVGVVLASRARAEAAPGWRGALPADAASLLAIAAAALLVFASFFLKEAATSFALENPRVGASRFEAASWTLFHVTWMEVAALTTWLLATRPSELAHVRQHGWRMAAIGACGFTASLGWFWAFSVGLVAYVRAIGQLEAVVAVIISLRLLGEQDVTNQIPGLALVVLGIILVLLG